MAEDEKKDGAEQQPDLEEDQSDEAEAKQEPKKDGADENPKAEGDSAEGDAGEKPKKKSSKKLIFIILGVVVLIGGGVGAYLMLTGGEKPKEGEVEIPEIKEEKKPKPEEIVNYEFPEILVNIRSAKSKVRFLKANLVLELGSKEDLAAVEKITPRIQDAFQVYLRELRAEDIRGPGSSDIIREALLERANKLAAPVKVHNVLYKSFIVQ